MAVAFTLGWSRRSVTLVIGLRVPESCFMVVRSVHACLQKSVQFDTVDAVVADREPSSC